MRDFVAFHSQITAHARRDLFRSLLSLVALLIACIVDGYFCWILADSGAFRAFGRPLLGLLVVLVPALGWSIRATYRALQHLRRIAESLPAHLRDLVTADG